MRTLHTRQARYVEEAAQLWAEATAARNHEKEIAGLDTSRPIISQVVESSNRSFLLVALSARGQMLAFAAVEPLGGGDSTVAEIRYLAVRPGEWNRGLGEKLLGDLKSRLPDLGFRHAELSVYVDNAPAIALYEHAGWRAAGQPFPHPRTGKFEQRYRIEVF